MVTVQKSERGQTSVQYPSGIRLTREEAKTPQGEAAIRAGMPGVDLKPEEIKAAAQAAHYITS